MLAYYLLNLDLENFHLEALLGIKIQIVQSDGKEEWIDVHY
jgi:hypothetical protein